MSLMTVGERVVVTRPSVWGSKTGVPLKSALGVIQCTLNGPQLTETVKTSLRCSLHMEREIAANVSSLEVDVNAEAHDTG